MKCPKCGNESVNSVGIEGPLEAWECLQCNTVWFMGHEEKVKGGKDVH
jgi:ribosomal protein L37AE/L43A